MLLTMVLSSVLLNTSSKISAAYVDCSTPKANSMSVQVYDLVNQKVVKVKPIQKRYGDKTLYTLSVSPGYYSVTVGRFRCSASFRVAAFAGSSFATMLYGIDAFALEEGGAGISGTLPAEGLQPIAHCRMRGAAQKTYYAIVERKQYFFNDIAEPASCDIVLHLAQQVGADVIVARNLIVGSSAKSRILNLNIGWASLMNSVRK